MIETGLTLLAVAAMATLVLAPWAWLLQAGAWAMAFGIAFGVPAGVRYHVLLHRELVRADALSARWWWRPLAQHRFLDEAGRRVVTPSCRIGAAGCGVIFLGAAVVVVGLVRAGF